MSYKELLQTRIEELKRQIASNFDERERLEKELNRLIKDEFEESLREEVSDKPQLLQE